MSAPAAAPSDQPSVAAHPASSTPSTTGASAPASATATAPTPGVAPGTSAAEAERWLDLDATPSRTVTRRRDPVRLAVIVAAVIVGALAGAGLATAGRPELPAAPPPTVAVMTLDTLVLEPVPSAVLDLRIDNLGSVDQVVHEVRVAGGGVADTAVPVGQALPAGEGVDTRVVVALRCGDSPVSTADRVTATVRVSPDDGAYVGTASDTTTRMTSGTAEVPAVGVGRAAELGGVCAAADAVLPGGWRTPARVTGNRVEGDELDLTVQGLPADATRVVWIEADGVLLPQPRLDPQVHQGAVRLRIPAPTPGCRDTGVRPVVPTGLHLHLQSPAGLRSAYAPVGSMVARWLMDAYVRACPARPAGPSAPPGTTLDG